MRYVIWVDNSQQDTSYELADVVDDDVPEGRVLCEIPFEEFLEIWKAAKPRVRKIWQTRDRRARELAEGVPELLLPVGTKRLTIDEVAKLQARTPDEDIVLKLSATFLAELVGLRESEAREASDIDIDGPVKTPAELDPMPNVGKEPAAAADDDAGDDEDKAPAE